MTDLPELGLGMVFLPGLEGLIESHLDLFDVIEIEPQTLWHNKDSRCDSFTFDRGRTELVLQYPKRKLLHSVGFPVGGTVYNTSAEFSLLRQHADIINPVWISEHLSFNKFIENDKLVHTNFLLPPIQSQQAIDVAIQSIRHFRTQLGRPFAFETGVNYLQKREDEIPDGLFISRIAIGADCNILLDLHNLMANQLNGRYPVLELVKELPAERICEIHIAGGFYHNNFYIDGHSGISGTELFQLLEKVVRDLPGLKALVFEMLPEYMDAMDSTLMASQFGHMRRIWDSRGKKGSKKVKQPEAPEYNVVAPFTPQAYEEILGKLVLGRQIPDTVAISSVVHDPGIPIIRELIFHFRASQLVTALKLTTRYLRLVIGSTEFTNHLQDFFSKYNPEIFAFAAALNYQQYLRTLKQKIPFLSGILRFEIATLETIVDQQPREVRLKFNPFPVFRSLAEGELPEEQVNLIPFTIEICPDALLEDSASFQYHAVAHN